jgi:small nuclear ribonucleoprotein (snRNP)-like protein
MKFNPSKALQMGQQMIERLPFPKTRRLDNLSRYQVVINASEDPLHFESNMINILNKKPLSHKSKNYVDPTETKQERKFLPHQMPIKSTRHEVKLCNLIQRISLMQGPLAKLREYKEKRIRLCIKTKNVFGGLNEFIAYLIAFDKHWNLALNDVTETFTRKIARKIPVDSGSEVKLSDQQLARRGLVRAVVVKQVGKKHEMCTRHLPQLLLRGSYVVVVTPAI